MSWRHLNRGWGHVSTRDGLLIGSGASVTPNSGACYLYAGINIAGQNFPGQVAGLAAYDYILSPQQVAEHYAAGPRPTSPAVAEMSTEFTLEAFIDGVLGGGRDRRE